jgi:hypothetical protein
MIESVFDTDKKNYGELFVFSPTTPINWKTKYEDILALITILCILPC